MKTYVLSFLLFCRRGYPPNADDERARSPQRPRPASWREREKSEHIHQVTASVQEKLAESSLAQLDAFLANFEPKFQMLLQAIQSPVVELVRSSTQQLNDSLAGLLSQNQSSLLARTKKRARASSRTKRAPKKMNVKQLAAC